MMKKHLGKDRNAEESLLKPVIFLFTFIGVAALLLSSMANIRHVSEGGISDTSFEFSTGTYTYWDPSDGWDVTWANATDLSPFDLDDMDFEFTSAAADSIWLGCVRNNTEYLPGSTTWYEKYEDMLTVTDYTGWFSYNREVVSFQTIDATHNESRWVEGNSTEVFVLIGSYNFTLVITTPGIAANFSTDLWVNNAFNVKLAEVSYDDYSAEDDWWTFIWQLLTLQLPDVHPFVNLLMAIPFWIAIGFIVIMLVSRMLPDWISGGG